MGSSLRKRLAALFAGISVSVQAIAASCTGTFLPISDICYDCVFPVKLAGINLGSGNDYDTGASKSPVCVCANNLTAGFPLSFWEPAYMVDTTFTAGCMPLLGGIHITIPWNQNQHGNMSVTNSPIGGRSRQAFVHVNEYLSPIMTLLGLINDSPCMDQRSFDTPYASWADPTWNDDTLAMILTPYAYPFVGAAAIAAEGADSVAAIAGFPIKEFFWTAGSWGSVYPVTGNIATVNTLEQVSRLATVRMLAKLHAAGLQQSTAGDGALKSCGAIGVPEFVMDKREYRYNRIYPFADNACTPISRPLMAVERNTGRPQDRDMGYYIFRRKDCCETFGATGL
jgi:conjugal transfer pilus assembly protein TraU